ncbi:MAG: hypothetical protein IJP35_00925 [Clostridia bacterium]|nr:hypothetical protein [Clostridia bacterium]
MKKALSIILLTVMGLLLMASLCLCIGFACEWTRLTNDPGASGLDYFGVGWGYGIVLFVVSVVGIIVAAISRKVQQQRVLKNISLGAVLAFVLLVFVAVGIFYT